MPAETVTRYNDIVYNRSAEVLGPDVDIQYYGRGMASLARPAAIPPIQKGTRVLISLWDSLMFGRVPGYLAMGFANVRAGTWYPPEH